MYCLLHSGDDLISKEKCLPILCLVALSMIVAGCTGAQVVSPTPTPAPTAVPTTTPTPTLEATISPTATPTSTPLPTPAPTAAPGSSSNSTGTVHGWADNNFTWVATPVPVALANVGFLGVMGNLYYDSGYHYFMMTYSSPSFSMTNGGSTVLAYIPLTRDGDLGKSYVVPVTLSYPHAHTLQGSEVQQVYMATFAAGQSMTNMSIAMDNLTLSDWHNQDYIDITINSSSDYYVSEDNEFVLLVNYVA